MATIVARNAGDIPGARLAMLDARQDVAGIVLTYAEAGAAQVTTLHGWSFSIDANKHPRALSVSMATYTDRPKEFAFAVHSPCREDVTYGDKEHVIGEVLYFLAFVSGRV